MQTLLEMVKVGGLIVAILFLSIIAYAIVDSFINNIKVKKAKRDFKEDLDKMLQRLLEEIEQEELEEKNKKRAKKTTRKPRKTKEEE